MTEPRHDPIAELYDALTTLTRDHEVTVKLKDVILGTRSENPLLRKLRNATQSNLGDGSGAGKSNKASVPLNVGARDLYDRICVDIRSWFEQLVSEASRNSHGRPVPEVTLTQWYLRFVNAYRSKTVSEELMKSRTSTLRDWTQQIRDLLDPPYRWPLTSPCPICGQEWVQLRSVDDPAEIERVRVLNAVERENIEDSFVVCRNPECGRIWRGLAGARELKIAMDDAELASSVEA